VLSPLLFNLYIKDIINLVPYNCKVIQFADDIAVLCQDKDVNRVYSSLRDTFDKVNEWLSGMGLELSIAKTQFILFHRSKVGVFPEEIVVRGGSIRRLSCVKYLGILMDSGLRWREHIRNLKVRTSKYMNILKWLYGRSWGIDPLQAINFVNATILAQLMWGAMWYINAAKSYLKQIDGIIISAYKLAMSLPRNSSNRVAWKLSNQPSFGARVAKKCDDYLCRASVLGKGKILNKSKFLWEQFSAGRVSYRKMPYLITRWRVVEPFFKFLFKNSSLLYLSF